MNRIKNNVIIPLKSQISEYDPIGDVCQILGDSCLVLSQNMDQLTNGGNVSFGRRMKYNAMFAIHLLVTIKYAILAIYDDIYTIAMFGESFHLLNNIYYCSRLCLSFQMAVLPIKFIALYFGDQFVANMLMTISRFQTSLVFIRINNRKVTAKIWLMRKLYSKSIFPIKWIVFPAAMFYYAILAYTISPIPVNLVTLAFNSTINCLWLINLAEICYSGAISFFFVMSMAQLRYKEIMYLVKCIKVAGFIRVNHSYNQLVIDIKMCRRLIDPIIGIIYLSIPFLFGLVCQLILDSHWLPRLLGVIALFIISTSNYIIYYMTSSICPMNKIIIKLLIPIQFDKRHKTQQIKLKIDSLIARLSKEFVGFYCLYSIKFTRMSFYEYILGISTTFLLLHGLVNPRQG